MINYWWFLLKWARIVIIKIFCYYFWFQSRLSRELCVIGYPMRRCIVSNYYLISPHDLRNVLKLVSRALTIAILPLLTFLIPIFLYLLVLQWLSAGYPSFLSLFSFALESSLFNFVLFSRLVLGIHFVHNFCTPNMIVTAHYCSLCIFHSTARNRIFFLQFASLHHASSFWLPLLLILTILYAVLLTQCRFSFNWCNVGTAFTSLHASCNPISFLYRTHSAFLQMYYCVVRCTYCWAYQHKGGSE